MSHNTITARQGICILIMFLLGNSLVSGGSTKLEQDSWSAFVFTMILVIPMVFVYGRIIKLFPGKNLFDISEVLFGKVVGKVFIALFTWYGIHLAGHIIRSFSEFIQIITMLETPKLPILIMVLLINVYLARSGMETLGKWSMVVLPIVSVVLVLTTLLALKDMKFDNILPILNHSPQEIAAASYETFCAPFGASVLFLCVADSIRKTDSPYHIYLSAILITALIFIVIIIRNIETLGAAMMSSTFFPSYTTARIINVANFLARIEGSISMNYLLAGMVKISLSLIAASKGIAKLFHLPKEKPLVVPVGLLCMALGAIFYDNIMQLVDSMRYYKVYAALFQIYLPVFFWLAGEIYVKRHPLAQ